VTLALVWLYNGLWLKVIALDAHHLQIVSSVCQGSTYDPIIVLRGIGSCETLLAAGIMSGLFYRFVSWFQVFIILTMNVMGGLFGGGAIAHPFGLLISNLPTFMCAILVALRGPGSFSLKLPAQDRDARKV